MNVKREDSKVSRDLTAGAPTKCFLPLCWKTFESSCVHAGDGHYYCSKECAEKGTRLDLSRVEELRPAATAVPVAAPVTPKRKLFGRSN